MKNKNTIIKLIIAIFFSVTLTFVFIFFIKIIKNKNRHASVSMITLEDKIAQKEKSIIFSEKIIETKNLQNSINNYFVNTDKIDTFVDFLEELGLKNDSKVLVKGIEVLKNNNNLVSFKISINGTFQQVAKTLIVLENIPYQINITQVYLNKDKQEDFSLKTKNKNNLLWQADVSFNILSLN